MFRPTLEIRSIPGGLEVRATRHKMFGGGVSERKIVGLTPELLDRYLQGELIQNVLGHLPVADRSFLLDGLNPGETL